MLSAFQVKVRPSNLTLRGIVKSSLKKTLKKKNIKDKLKDFKKLMLIICLLLNFVFGKKKILMRGMCFGQEVQEKKLTLF